MRGCVRRIFKVSNACHFTLTDAFQVRLTNMSDRNMIFTYICGFIQSTLPHTLFLDHIVFFRLGDTAASEFYVPTFRNYSIFIGCVDKKMEKCSEMSALKIRTPGNHSKERLQHWQQGESLKSRILDHGLLYAELWWTHWSLSLKT
jgi:hypothetical protein